jgi:putative ABC transport system permease protein
MARLCWPGEDPLGKRIRDEQSRPDGDAWYTVVGVVGDAKDWSLDAEVNPEYYQPYQRTRPTYIQFMVRAGPGLDLLTASRTVRREIKAIDPYLPAPKVWSVEKEFFDSTAPRRTYLMLMGLFAAMGLFLALIGIYGVVSTFVNQRTHEIGIRMALGARQGNILRLAIRNGLLLICAGSIIGLAGAVVLTRTITSLLYGISPADPVTLAGTYVLLVTTGLAACYVPARRATKVDPVVALRCE